MGVRETVWVEGAPTHTETEVVQKLLQQEERSADLPQPDGPKRERAGKLRPIRTTAELIR